mgnify:CR=1 FL=1
MKKRTKIIAISITLCMCLSMFVVGVLANITVSFNVTSTLNFIADSVYVMAEGEIKLGNDYTSASKPTEIPEGSDYDYIGYSYTPIGSGNNAPIASEVPTGFTNNWEINAINFSSENKVVVYYFKFTNYSNFEVMATNVNNISTVESNLQNQISVQTYVDGAVTTSKTYNVVIPAKSGETPGTKTLEIVITLTDFMTPITSEVLEFTFTFDKYEDTSKYFTYMTVEESGIESIAGTIEFNPDDLLITGLTAEGETYFTTAKDFTFPSFDSNNTNIVGIYSDIGSSSYFNVKDVIIPEGYLFLSGVAFGENTGTVSIPSTLLFILGLFIADENENPVYADNAYFEVAEGNLYLFSDKGALYMKSLAGILETYNLMLVPGANYALPNIPEDKNIETLGNYLIFNYGSPFAHRRNFVSYEVPSFITNISSAFNRCKDIETIIVNGDVVINEGCFGGCTSLQSVVFEKDASFETIDAGHYAFSESDTALQKIVFKGEISPTLIGSMWDLGCPSSTKIYVENTTTLNEGNLDLLTNTFTIQDIYFYQTADPSSVLTTNGYTNAGTVSEDGKCYTHFTKA